MMYVVVHKKIINLMQFFVAIRNEFLSALLSQDFQPADKKNVNEFVFVLR